MNRKNQDGSLSERKRNDGSLNGRKRLARVNAAKNIVRSRKVLMLNHLMQHLATNDQNELLLQYYIDMFTNRYLQMFQYKGLTHSTCIWTSKGVCM